MLVIKKTEMSQYINNHLHLSEPLSEGIHKSSIYI
jgi:hypothetical protein